MRRGPPNRTHIEKMNVFKICIVTPSYNQVEWLKKCVASVADQLSESAEHRSWSLEVHHHVQDAGSNDGTVEFLEQNESLMHEKMDDGGGAAGYSFSYSSEPDEGMYDAINKGLQRVDADVYAYLSCDEQYLVGTLLRVAEHFSTHPDTDAVYGDMLCVNTDGSLSSYRKSYKLRECYVHTSHLYVPPCTLFWRKRVLDKGALFNTRWKARGDGDFVLQLLGMGTKFVHIHEFLAAFFLTGNNLGRSDIADEEAMIARRELSRFLRMMIWPLNGLRRLEKLAAGAYSTKFPLRYSVYETENDERTDMVAHSGTFRGFGSDLE